MRRSLRMMLGVVVVLALTAPGSGQAAPAQPAVQLQWTINGQPVGPVVVGPAGANDVHFIARDGVLDRMEWTTDGEPNGLPVPAPEGANDLHLFWTPGTATFVGGYWTKDGVRIGPFFRAPGGSNDAHAFLVAGQFFGAIWTRNRRPIGRVQAPQGANDVHVNVLL
jgi:hypothetical protein